METEETNAMKFGIKRAVIEMIWPGLTKYEAPQASGANDKGTRKFKWPDQN